MAQRAKPIVLVAAVLGALGIGLGLGFAAGRLTAPTAGAGGTATQPGEAARTTAETAERAPDEGSPVVRVVDGDTVIVRYRAPEPPEGNEEHVRLLNINTPERGQPRYREATEDLRSLLSAADGTPRRVELVFQEPGARVPRDQYGRVLAYVVAGGVNVNVEMVRRGWSAYWTEYGAGLFEAEFRAAEAEARREERGIWSDR